MTATILTHPNFQRPARRHVCPLSEALASLRKSELETERLADYAERVAATVGRALERDNA